MKLMIFSGTTEGHDLCRFLSKNNVQAEVFVATEYGAAVMEPMAGITVHDCAPRNGKGGHIACPFYFRRQKKEVFHENHSR